MSSPTVLLLLLALAEQISGSTVQGPRSRLAAAASDARRACRRLRGGQVEHTFAMLKPDVAGSEEIVEEVMRMVADAGLTVERTEYCLLSKRDCEAFYAEHSERPFFAALVEFVRSKPVLKMELSGPNAIKAWRTLLGPTNSAKAKEEAPESIRAKFGTDGMQNAAHGSDSPESAERELKFMFKGDGFPKSSD